MLNISFFLGTIQQLCPNQAVLVLNALLTLGRKTLKAYAPEFSIISIFISTGKGNGSFFFSKMCWVLVWTYWNRFLVGFWTVTSGDKKVKEGIKKADSTGCHFVSACITSITFEMARKSKIIACI